MVLLVPKLQEQFALAAGPVSNWAGGYADNFTPGSLAGQFGLGLLLGAVWSPCVGPTLGAASVLAAKGEDLAQVALTMLAFGIGAALPLMLLGLLSREAMMRWRGRLMETGKAGKTLLGVLLVAVGLLVATNLDKRLETILVDASPAWLTRADHEVLTAEWLTARVRYPSRDSRASSHADSSAGTAGRCGGARTPWGDRASAPGTSSPPAAACRPSADCRARRR